jgi:hypothetical protein
MTKINKAFFVIIARPEHRCYPASDENTGLHSL